MKRALASVTVLAAVGLVAGVGAASACDWHKSHETAATPVPAEEQIATPANPDSLRIADATPAAIVPATPREEEEAAD